MEVKVETGKDVRIEPTPNTPTLLFRYAEESLILISLLLAVACGKVGPPLYPEEIGLAVKQEEHRVQQNVGAAATASDPPQDGSHTQNPPDRVPEEGEVVLPPLRPLGSQ